MQITKVIAQIGGMVQPRSFENIKRDLSIEVELDEDDDLEAVLEQVHTQGRRALAQSLVDEFRTRFDVTDYRWTETPEEVRTRLGENNIFQAIAANGPEIADGLAAECVEKWQAYKDDLARRVAEREAEAEAQRREMAKVDISDGVGDDDPDEDDNLGGVGDIDPDEDTAESDYDDDADEEDDEDDTDAAKEYA